ncbi:MAG: ABC transporter substrate-binding protein [Microbacterium sp.]|uniref:ABC transporter substrate-binding protein n=1 Tax=Microbacterium ginsengisoli TaxID=400772 RepID=A0A3C1KDK8_9MICO|nr:ABC transporter substrate-binding protein [uncultured Microbacterium sp.]MAL06641.1 ABC transporter substrate-binding protein [Microbacterium sp.]HAN24563.1 ABC transporter substrate-binding protein [Microbacterium ginsengisoli]
MVHPKKALVAAAALAGAATLVLAGCSSSSTPTSSASASASTHADPAAACKPGTPSTGPLKIATILPQTGSLAYLNPPAEAGYGLAVQDINAAGGVLGQPVQVGPITDSGASSDLSVSTASAAQIASSDAQVVLGAESSSVTLNFVDTITSKCKVQISPANTATALSGYSSYYFRTAPPDTVQGSALGNLIVGDGVQKLGFLVFNDAYGTGLRDVVEDTVTKAGGSIVYGAKGKGQEFAPGQTTFSSEVSAVLAAKPDAIAILAFDETKSIVPELKAQGWDMSKVYMVDGNTADYSTTFAADTLTGAQGTIPGAQPDATFKQRLVDFYKTSANADLKDFSYAPESYDAIVLAALAADKGKGTDGPTIQANLAAVSGVNGGEKCADYASCLALLNSGKDIQYTGKAGIGPFNSENDPSSAFIGIYKFDATNVPVFQKSIQGSTN